MEKNEEKKIKKTKKGTIVLSSILFVVAIGLGVGSGIVVKKFFGGGEDGNYDNVDAKALAYTDTERQNFMSKYENALSSKKDLSKTLTGPEMVSVALNLYSEEEHSFAQGIGTALAAGLATQEIRSTQIRDGIVSFEESNSNSSFVHLADRMYQEDGSTKIYKGSIGSGVEVGKYDTSVDPETLSNEDYSELMGRMVSNPCSYIISDRTLYTDTSLSGIDTSVSKTDSGYTVHLELDPATSVTNYVKQMKTISNLAAYPKFYYVHLQFNLNSKCELIDSISYESYKAKVSAVISSDIEGKLRTVYETGGSYEIPELNTPIEYRSEQ